MVQAMDQRARGEISVEACEAVFTEVKAKLPRLFAPAPVWLPPAFATELLEYVQAQGGLDRVAELTEWLQCRMGRGRGAPISKELDPIFREAAILHINKISWRKIAERLCPLRHAAEHTCDKRCMDRIRQGASEYS